MAHGKGGRGRARAGSSFPGRSSAVCEGQGPSRRGVSTPGLTRAAWVLSPHILLQARLTGGRLT